MKTRYNDLPIFNNGVLKVTLDSCDCHVKNVFVGIQRRAVRSVKIVPNSLNDILDANKDLPEADEEKCGVQLNKLS